MNVGDSDLGDALRVAPRGTGEITESTALDDALQLDFINNPRERAWFQSDTLYYQEYAGWDLALRSVPLAGGEITAYAGLVRDVVDFPSLLAFGARDEFDMALQLMTVSVGTDPIVVGTPLTSSRQGVSADSRMTPGDIFDTPWRRSTKMIGDSTIRQPIRSARYNASSTLIPSSTPSAHAVSRKRLTKG